MSAFEFVLVSFAIRAQRFISGTRERTLPFLESLGAESLYAGLAGPEFCTNDDWDVVLVVRYPSFAVLVAELAVAIAGFSSVVVALGRRPVADWLPGEQRNLRILLQVSAIVGSAAFAEATYLCVLVWHLSVAGMGFAFLIFRRHSGAV